jgi:hypothetical protein
LFSNNGGTEKKDVLSDMIAQEYERDTDIWYIFIIYLTTILTKYESNIWYNYRVNKTVLSGIFKGFRNLILWKLKCYCILLRVISCRFRDFFVNASTFDYT